MTVLVFVVQWVLAENGKCYDSKKSSLIKFCVMVFIDVDTGTTMFALFLMRQELAINIFKGSLIAYQ